MALNNSKKDIVIDNLDKIKEWIGQGVPMGLIAKNIGVSKTTLYKHVGESEQGLNSLDTIKKLRQPAVDKLEAVMFESACGFTRKVKRRVKLKHITYNDNGKKADEYEELVEYEDEEYFRPDTTAGIFLLKNWSNYGNEPIALEIRKREIELKEKQAW